MRQLPTLILLVLLISTVHVTAGTTYVVETGESIQAAIDNASSGDRIEVMPGLYNENIVINKTLIVYGDMAKVNSTNESEHAIVIEADDVRLEGFEVVGSTNNSAGIFINRSSGCIVTGNHVHENRYGIYLTNCSLCTVHNNIADDNTLYGIDLINTTTSMISNNSVCDGHYCGIALYRSQDNVVMFNEASHNSQCAGILLYTGCHNNTLICNDIRYNHQYGGILLYTGCTDNTIYENTVIGNTGLYGGITLYSCGPNNTLTRNRVVCNTPYGLLFEYSPGNLVYDNILANNINVRDHNANGNTYNVTPHPGTNILGGPWVGGNSWTDYTEADTDQDGLGNTPRTISTASQDYHPLIQPVCGDVDWNGYVSANDVIQVYRAAVDPSYPITHVCADVDGNSYISANDVIQVYRAAVDPSYDLDCTF